MKILGALAGGIIGFGLGMLLPYLMVLYTVSNSGDRSAAGGMFLVFATVPMGTISGGIIGCSFINRKIKNEKTK